MPSQIDNLDQGDVTKNSSLQMIPPDKIRAGLEFDLRKIFNEVPVGSRFIFTKHLRRDLYTLLAETKDLKKNCRDLVNAFVAYVEKNIFPKDSTSIDMLCLLTFVEATPLPRYQDHILPTISCKIEKVPLFPELRLQTNCNSEVNGYMKRKVTVQLASSQHIGVQHIVLSSKPDSSSNSSSVASSDSSDLLEFASPTKRARMEAKKKIEADFLKVCQEAKQIDPKSHHKNFYRDPIIFCQVDILILIDTKVQGIGVTVAKHMGLISVEDIFGAAMPKFEAANNPAAKTYKLLQTNIAMKLMNGFSNIVVTSDLLVWSHICANVRAIITDGTTYLGMDKTDADYYVCVTKKDEQTDLTSQDLTLTCIAAITEIISKSLGFDISVPVKYEEPQNEVSTVNFPITSIIPLYIIRYLIQLCHATFHSNKKLEDLFKEENN